MAVASLLSPSCAHPLERHLTCLVTVRQLVASKRQVIWLMRLDDAGSPCSHHLSMITRWGVHHNLEMTEALVF